MSMYSHVKQLLRLPRLLPHKERLKNGEKGWSAAGADGLQRCMAADGCRAIKDRLAKRCRQTPASSLCARLSA